MRVRTALLALPLVLVPMTACAPQDDSKTTATETSSAPTSATPSDTTSATATGSPSESTAAAGAISADCMKGSAPTLAGDKLTIATDSPAYDPWFANNDPTNGKGYESAVAYDVAERLGFAAGDVSWVKVPFNSSYKPGDKNFDFDINQISITPERAQVVDFSDGYYAAAQAVVALKDSDIAKSTSIGDLAFFKLGAQTGTTSLTAARETIKPHDDPSVFEDTNAAKQALLNSQIDGIVVDLPTAFYITAAEIKDSVIVGQFQPVTGEQEQFGMLFQKGNPLVSCVDQAIAALKADGTLDQLEQQWLSNKADVPVLQ